MREVAVNVAPQARDVLQVSRLAVTLGEAREDADDLGIALRAERGVGEGECVTIEPSARGDAGTVVVEQLRFKLGRYIKARILQKRDEVVGGGAAHGILKVDHPDARNALSLRQPEKIGRVVVAQHPAWRRFC